MKLISAFILIFTIVFCAAGCRKHTLTITRVGEGRVFPKEGVHVVRPSTIPIIAYEHYGPFEFMRYEGVDKHTTEGSYYVASVDVDIDRVVKVYFRRKKENTEWIKGKYTITTKGRR